MSGDIERRPDQFDQAGSESVCRGRFFDARLHDGEFVTAEPRDRVRVTQLPREPFGHGPQQFVTDRMTQRVVHRFELVEVEEEQRQAVAMPHMP